MSDEVRTKLLSLLNREDLLGIEIGTCAGNEFANISNEDNDELLASQDFPTMFQSQTTQTLLHCNICEFLCRSKPQFEEHVSSHPTCNICMKAFLNEDDLGVHNENEHEQQVIKCTICHKDVKLQDVENHKNEHETFDSFKKALDRNSKLATKVYCH